MSRVRDYDLMLGQIIQGRRLALAMTRADLAEKLNMSAVVLGRIEHGDSSLSAADLVRLAGVFDCTINELLGEPEIPAQTEAWRLLSAWSMLDNIEQRRSFMYFLEALAKA